MKNIIVNTEFSFVTDKLINMGFNIIPVIKSRSVSGPISGHSDVLYNRVSDCEIIISSCQKANLRHLEAFGYKVSVYNDLKPGYKTECGLNFIQNNEITLKNPKTAILKNNNSKNVLHVRQGYTRCSVIEIDENNYITDDIGIFNTLSKAGYGCLIVKKGIAVLPGYEYGFIGGTAINLQDGNILFCGDIEDSEEKNRIIQFVNINNCNCIFIKNERLTDIGSGLIL